MKPDMIVENAEWAAELSASRVNELFRAIEGWRAAHPDASSADCLAMAMTVIASDVMDVFAVCVCEDCLEEEIANLVTAIRHGFGPLKKSWHRRMSKVAEPPESTVVIRTGHKRADTPWRC